MGHRRQGSARHPTGDPMPHCKSDSTFPDLVRARQCAGTGDPLQPKVSATTVVAERQTKVSATTVVAERQKEQHMTDIMIRVEAEDYDAWLKTHYDHVEDRHSYGMTDGPSTETSITRIRRCSTSTSRTSTVRCSGSARTRSRKRRSGPRSLVGTSTWPRSSNLALRRSPWPPREFARPRCPEFSGPGQQHHTHAALGREFLVENSVNNNADFHLSGCAGGSCASAASRGLVGRLKGVLILRVTRRV
jgi:hypothetical protein